MNLNPGYEGLPMAVISGGRVQPANLKMTGRDLSWLEGLLAARGLGVRDVFLASLDTHGRMTMQLTGGGLVRFKALEPGEVAW